LEEKSCSGFVKALLIVAHLFSSPVEQISDQEAQKLVCQIYSAIFAMDHWKEFNAHNAEQFKLKADQTAVASVLFRLSEMSKYSIELKCLTTQISRPYAGSQECFAARHRAFEQSGGLGYSSSKSTESLFVCCAA
jgi:hypothetical protein